MRARPIGLCGLALLLAACNHVQTSLEPAADQASAIYGLGRLLFWVCAFMYLLVLAFLGGAIWRARRRLEEPRISGAAASPNEKRLSNILVGWTALIVIGLFVLTLGSFLVDRSLAHPPGPPIRVKVTGNQWWWRIEYQSPDPDDPSQGVTTANELHLPVNRTAEIELQSSDVIHSFWAPNLHGKMDLIPGRTNTIELTPRRTGLFRGQCAEYCGLQHAHMAFQVIVQRPADFSRWYAGQLQPAETPISPQLATDQKVFVARCGLCHTVRGTGAAGKVAPDLTHLMSRGRIAAGALPNTLANLSAWIADPQTAKPGAQMPELYLSGPELNQIRSYLLTLK